MKLSNRTLKFLENNLILKITHEVGTIYSRGIPLTFPGSGEKKSYL